MSITRPNLLDLRGHFGEPRVQEAAKQRQSSSLASFLNVFPLSDYLAVLITPTQALLVDIEQQDILWTITCAAETAALDTIHHLLALATHGRIALWNLQTGRLLHSISIRDNTPTQLVFSPDGSWLAVALFEQGVQIRSTANGQLLQTLSDDQFGSLACMKSLAVSPDGSLLALGSYEHSHIGLWRVQDGALLRSLELHPHAERVFGLAFSPDGHYLIAGEIGGASHVKHTPIWDVASGRLLIGLSKQSWLPAFGADGRMLASTSIVEMHTQTLDMIYLWDVGSRRLQKQITGHRGRVSGLAFCPGGRMLISYGEDATVRWWDLQSGQECYRLEGLFSTRTSAAFRPDGQMLAAGTWDGKLRLWSIPDSKLLRVLQWYDSQAEGVSLSSDGHYLVAWEQGSLSPGALQIWNVGRKREPVRIHAEGYERVFFASISPDSSLLMAACDDQCLRIWSRSKERLIHTLWGHTTRICCAALSPDQRRAVAGALDGSIRLWSLHKGSSDAPDAELIAHTARVNCLAFTSNGHFLASGDAEGALYIWHGQTGVLIQQLDDMPAAITCITFHPDGTSFAACDRSNTIWIWRLEPHLNIWQRYEDELQQTVELRSHIMPLEERRSDGVFVWHLLSTLGTWQILQAHVHIIAMAFHPHHTTLFVAGYDSGPTTVWRLEDAISHDE